MPLPVITFKRIRLIAAYIQRKNKAWLGSVFSKPLLTHPFVYDGGASWKRLNESSVRYLKIFFGNFGNNILLLFFQAIYIIRR